jgi:hypothetical protein
MAQQEGWTPDDVRNIILNPAHCLVEPPTISEGQWISANARLIAELGPEKYLRALLDVLKGS